MSDTPPTGHSRAEVLSHLGAQLRALRKAAGLSVARAARHAGVGEHAVWDWEKGAHAVSPNRLAKLLDAYQISEGTRHTLFALAEAAQPPSTPIEPNGVLPDGVHLLVRQERCATAIRAFCPTMIPAWFQTRAYARAIFAGSPTIPTTDIDAWVKVWQSRAEIPSQPQPPCMSLLLAERALHTPPARPQPQHREMMAHQRRHLTEDAARHRVEVRILPTTAYAPTRAIDQFVILDLPGMGSVVHAHTEWSDRLVDDPDDVAAYERRLTDLAAEALDPQASQTLITSGCA